MKQLIDIRDILIDEDYTRLLQCREMQEEMEDIDKQVDALTAHRAEISVDGRDSVAAGGPRRKDGGLEIQLYQRLDGSIHRAYTLKCYVDRDGKLRTEVFDENQSLVDKLVTER
jgi:hypothetical protein